MKNVYFKKMSTIMLVMLLALSLGVGCSGSGGSGSADGANQSTDSDASSETDPDTVVTPEFSSEAGTYNEAFEVTITTDTDGATIYYTNDGSDPVCGSGNEYTAPENFSDFNSSVTIKAVACKDGMKDSSVATIVYTLDTIWRNISSFAHLNCGVRTDSTLWCWGYDKYENLVNKSTTELAEPTQIGGESDWQSVDVGNEHVCALKTNNKLYCWGDNAKGQLGIDTSDPNKNTPTLVDGEWNDYVAGYYHTCGIKTDDTLWCWGQNTYGQLGDDTIVQKNKPMQVGSDTWIDVTAGDGFTCAIKSDETLWCWGDNDSANNVIVGSSNNEELTPYLVSSGAFKTVVAGYYYACAIKDDNSLWCWGYNSDGQVGEGGLSDPVTTLTQIRPDLKWKNISLAEYISCATTTENKMYCWGYNGTGSLGINSFDDAKEPQLLDGEWQSSASGSQHACGLDINGSVKCWGGNSYGQIGNGRTDIEAIPVQEKTKATDWEAVTAGADHTCALKEDGSIWCWGSNSRGQIGNGESDGSFSVLEHFNVVDPSDESAAWKKIEASSNHHTCAIKEDDESVYCWGADNWGQVGNDSSTMDTLLPDLLGNLAPNFRKISGGYFHTCAINGALEMYCWGHDYFGQLGNGASNDPQSVPYKSSGVNSNWLEISAGGYFNCGLKNDDSLWCWGQNNQGQVGNGTTSSTPVSVPTEIVDPVNAEYSKVDSGYSHSCAIRSDDSGQIYCWGVNNYGQLTGTAAFVEKPTLAITASWSDVSAGRYHTCAIKNGEIWCWGKNSSAQLGHNEDVSKETAPVQEYSESTDWISVSAGGGHTCSLNQDKEIWCWGSNYHGALGNGYSANYPIPTDTIEP